MRSFKLKVHTICNENAQYPGNVYNTMQLLLSHDVKDVSERCERKPSGLNILCTALTQLMPALVNANDVIQIKCC